MKIKKLISIILVVMMMTTMLVGCSNTNTQEKSQPKEVTITDHAGREVKVTGNYEKIVSGYYISTSMLVSLGLNDKLVGIESKAEKRPLYKLAAKELLELPKVGTAKDFDLEGCIALKPDLVILPKKLTEQAKTLSDAGITVIVINPENEKLLKESIEMVATATGTTEKAKKLLSYYDEQYAKLEKLTKDSKEKPSVYLAGTSDILTVASGKMYQNSVIEKAGGVNVAKDLADDQWAKISYEQLLKYNPDMIVIIPEAEFTKEDVLKDPQLANLNAVKNKAVYEMPSDFEAWDSPVPSCVLGSMWLASIIDEEGYSFDDFKNDAASFYKEFYNVDIDKELVTK
ncbi:ABC transporter substrate-binding protein [Terrisporobacter petrolearius]|uniref:ABC transporter substrate-binding protein n=1 Tax=Terrisporobacter petrolearius TaxID=1460447 RepID=UPI001D16262E|nr:ABC transporter substrate-binding protein [Terrisporobacter petrolearius]MCC3863912.1 ABC transporter substrate-binding protein [Terrisporobacter petrolearius]